MDTNGNPPLGWHPGRGAKGRQHSNRPRNSTSFPEVIGGRTWRRRNGLETIGDRVLRWRAARYTPPGCLCPLPDSLLPRWQGVTP